jgi:hypothetical protein
MRGVDRRSRFDDHRGTSDRAIPAPCGPMAYSRTDKKAVGNVLRRVRFFRKAPEDACPKQIWQRRGQRSECSIDRLLNYCGMLYDSAAILGWGSILRDEHRGRLFYPIIEDLLHVGKALVGVDDFAMIAFNATSSKNEP